MKNRQPDKLPKGEKRKESKRQLPGVSIRMVFIAIVLRESGNKPIVKKQHLTAETHDILRTHTHTLSLSLTRASTRAKQRHSKFWNYLSSSFSKVRCTQLTRTDCINSCFRKISRTLSNKLKKLSEMLPEKLSNCGWRERVAVVSNTAYSWFRLSKLVSEYCRKQVLRP